MSEQNKNVVRRLFEEVWNKGNVSVADELFSSSYNHHDSSSPDFGRGPESEKKRATLYRNAFPDMRFTIEEIVAEGETVVARWSCRGTHKGDLNGIAPTGKQFNITGVSIARFTNGKMFEGFVNWDALGLMQQVGVVPELGKAKATMAVGASTR
ncbi:MAG: ester cyclase [Candidatus Acidiferrum sp.]